MAGLVRKKVTVRSKKGKTYQRSVMVRAGEAVKRVGQFVSKHKGKIAAGAIATAGMVAAAHYGVRNAGAIHGALAAGKKAFATRNDRGEKSAFQHLRDHVSQGFSAGQALDREHHAMAGLAKTANNMHANTGHVASMADAAVQHVAAGGRAPKTKKARKRK